MSVKVIYDNYSDLCKHYIYGKQFLELPERIIVALNNHFDGCEFHVNDDDINPDKVYRNCYFPEGNKNVLVRGLSMLPVEEYEYLALTGELDAYISEHYSEIIEGLSEHFTVLGYANFTWHLLL